MRLIRFILFGGTAAAIAVALWSYISFTPHGNDPLLSGPPQFVILALIVAFAVYLRQVSLHAAELRERIVHGEAWNYPPTEDFAKDKMMEADKTCDLIRFVSPFMILMIIAVSCRIVCESWVRLIYPRGTTPAFLFSTDLFIAMCLFLGFFGLVMGHRTARSVDDRIRKAARKAEPDILLALQGKVDS